MNVFDGSAIETINENVDQRLTMGWEPVYGSNFLYRTITTSLTLVILPVAMCILQREEAWMV